MDKYIYRIIVCFAGCVLLEHSVWTDNLQIRLTNSPEDNKNSGLLEIRHNDVWGTVCGANFNASAAKVVCNMLKLPSGAAFSYYFHSDFIKGTPNTTWLTKVACSGKESTIGECELGPWGGDGERCLHYWDVGVECTDNQITHIRLSGGQSDHEGRVEIFYDGVWGSICDEDFTDATATVACRMLNLSSGHAERLPRSYKITTAAPKKVWMRQVQCTGQESTLSVCRHHRMGGDFCGHLSDVRVNCFADKPFYRLTAGNTSYGGRLEVYHNATWGTVCDDGIRNGTAQVVCAMFGYQRTGALARMRAYFGNGSDPIWLDQIQCKGFEQSLSECTRFPWGYAHCSHKEDAGVSCSEDTFLGSLVLDPVYRLLFYVNLKHDGISRISLTGSEHMLVISSDSYTAGDIALDTSKRIVYFTNQSQIERVRYDESDKAVVVSSGVYLAITLAVDEQNGVIFWMDSFKRTVEAVNSDGTNRRTLFKNSNSIFTDMSFLGNEIYYSDLSESTLLRISAMGGTHAAIGPPTLDNVHGIKAYRSGHGPARNIISDKRLVNGSSPKYGTLEVKVAGQWQGVCGDSVDLGMVEVICRSMGYVEYGLSNDALRFVNFNGPEKQFFALPYTNCVGNESTLTECDVSDDWNNTCQSNRDVIIDCAPSMEEIVYLQCYTNAWHIEVDLIKLYYRFPGFLYSDIYLGDNSCTGSQVRHYLVIDESFDSCITQQKYIKDGIVFENQLIYANRDWNDQSEVQSFNWTLKLSCTNQNDSSTGHVTPFNQSLVAYVNPNASLEYHLATEFFSDPNFSQHLLGSPLTVAGGSLVYVKVYVPQADWTIKMKVITCYTTSSNGDRIKDYFLIKHGCEVDTNTHFISQTMHETKFVFQLFEKTTSLDDVFVHCDVIYCDTSNSAALQLCDDQCLI